MRFRGGFRSPRAASKLEKYGFTKIKQRFSKVGLFATGRPSARFWIPEGSQKGAEMLPKISKTGTSKIDAKKYQKRVQKVAKKGPKSHPKREQKSRRKRERKKNMNLESARVVSGPIASPFPPPNHPPWGRLTLRKLQRPSLYTALPVIRQGAPRRNREPFPPAEPPPLGKADAWKITTSTADSSASRHPPGWFPV